MSVTAPDDIQHRVIKSDKELHVSLEVPSATAHHIHHWVKQQQWPDGTTLDPPRDYHVTLLYTPEGHDQFKDAWWIDHVEQYPASISDLTAFGPSDDGYAYVLLLDAPEIQEHAEEMQTKAEWMGLPITHFPGGYQPHITIGYGPTKNLSFIRSVPTWSFDVGPSSVSVPRPKEAASLASIAGLLHDRFLQAPLDAVGARESAIRLLAGVGYPIDQITTQAALQAWQQLHPGDDVLNGENFAWSSGDLSHTLDQFMLESTYANHDRIHDGQPYPGAGIPRGRGGAFDRLAAEQQPLHLPERGRDDDQPLTGDDDHVGGPAEHVGLLAGRGKGRRTAAGGTSPELEAIIDAFARGYGVTLLASEDTHEVSFDHIEIPPETRGQGVGSRVMAQLKSYCDRRDKMMVVQHVVNYPFFASLGWLNFRGPDQFVYIPSAQDQTPHSTVPSEVNNPEDRIPEFGQRPLQQHDVQFSNDFSWHPG